MSTLIFLVLSFFLAATLSAKENLTTLITRSDVIWGFDFINENEIIFNEKSGKMFHLHVKTKKITEISGVPQVYSVGQAGLLDIRVHPQNKWIYFTFSKPLPALYSATTLMRAKFMDGQLKEKEELFTATPSNKNDYHYGSRIEFDSKGHVFITSGERGDRPAVQRLDNHLGKVIRLNLDGTIPSDNPYVKNKEAKPEIWSLGHRSPQGLVMKPGTDELWEAEMGPQGGDEVNLIKPSLNYGWAVVTYGKEYDGPKIGEGEKKSGMEEPQVYWVPSISPSGIAFHKNDLWLGTLSGQHLRRVKLQGTKVMEQKIFFKELGWRFRNLRTSPDGKLWFSTDEGRIGLVEVN